MTNRKRRQARDRKKLGGRKSSAGSTVLAGGEIYTGGLCNGQPHGVGKTQDAEGRMLFEGMFHRGMRVSGILSQDGIGYSQTYVNGLLVDSTCGHCSPIFQHGQKEGLMFFMEAFQMPDADKMSGFEAGIHAMLHASQHNPRILANDDHRNSIRSMFISDVATRLHSCRRFSADWFCSIRHRCEGIAVAIYLLEHHEPGQRLTRCLFPPHQSDCYIKLLDAVNGCDRSLLKFYKERVPCNCLDEVYGLFRQKPKTGICHGCGVWKKRRELLICTRSKDASFCSRMCQETYLKNGDKKHCCTTLVPNMQRSTLDPNS